MPDYYAVLARAVVDLDPHDATTRAELYERARESIAAELRKRNPNISALAVAREQALLDVDIRRLEADLSPPAPDKKDDRQTSDFTLGDELDVMPKSLAAL